MPLTDQQIDHLLNQQITQHEAERAGHQANIAKIGVFLAASTPGSSSELDFIAGIERSQTSVSELTSAIAELKRMAGQPNSGALLAQRATDVVALAATRKRKRPPEQQPEQPDVTPGPGNPPRR